MGLGEMAHRPEEYDGDWEEVHGEGKGKSKAPSKGHGKVSEQEGGEGPQKWTLGQEAPDYFPYNCHNYREKGHKVVHCGKPFRKRQRKKGVDGVDDQAVEEAEQPDPGDLDLCAVDDLWDVGVGQPSASLADDFPPGLIDAEFFGPWHLYMGATSRRDLWTDRIEKDTHKRHRDDRSTDHDDDDVDSVTSDQCGGARRQEEWPGFGAIEK